MRIASGADFFGQRIAKVYPTDDIESSNAMIRSKGGYQRNLNDIQGELARGQAVAGEVGRVGNVLTDIGLEEIQHQDTMKLIEQKKIQERLDKATAEKAHSDSIVFAVNYASEAESIFDNVFNNPNIKDTDKPHEIENQLSGLKDAWAQTLPPDQQHAVAAPHAKAVAAARSKFADYQTAKLTEETKGNVMTIYNQLIAKAARSPKDADEAISAWDMVLDQDSIRSSYKAPELVAMRQTLRSHVYENEVKHNLNFVDKDGNFPNAEKMVDVLRATDTDGSPLNYKNMNPTDREAFILNAEEKKLHTDRNIAAIKKARQHEWEKNLHLRFEIFKENIKAGIVNSTDFSTKLYKDVKGTQYEPLFTAIKQQGEDPAHQWELLNKDPLKYGAAMSGMQLKPLNLNDPAGAVAALNYNYSVGKRVQAKYGLTYVPSVQAETIKQLAKYIKDDPQGGVKFLHTIADKFNQGSVQTLTPAHESTTGIYQLTGGQLIQSIASHMASVDEGKHAEQAIIVRSVASGDYDTAYDIATGKKLIRDKAVMMPENKALEKKFIKMLGNSMKDNSFNSVAAYSAFEPLYAAAINEKGGSTGTLDDTIAENVFKKVVGKVVKYQALDTIIPHGFTEEQFINNVKGIDAVQIKQAGKVSDNIGGVLDDDAAAQRIVNDGQFYMVAPNTYRVVLQGIELKRADGRPFHLSFTDPAKQPLQRERNEDVFSAQWKNPGQVFK